MTTRGRVLAATMERTSFTESQPEPLPRRAGLRSKVLLLFAPLFVVLGGLIAFTTIEARKIRVDLERVVEEQRELELSKTLAAELIGAEAWAGRRTSEVAPDVAVVEDLVGHIHRARAIVNEVARGPAHEDPSEPSHQGRELALQRSLQQALDQAEAQARKDADWSALAAGLQSARREAQVLEAESKEEAHEAATDLDRRVHRLVNMLHLVAGTVVLTLLLLSAAFRRLVLRPLRLLRQAALELGHDGHQVPVPVLSRDEFGQLTHAFNGMAARLQSHREDLELRVRERTGELIRTARLADLGTIAAGLAHEINNPLASIATGAEGLRRELQGSSHVSAETLRYIDIVVREAYRTKDIASRLLRLGRQEQRRIEPVWLQEEAKEVASMLAFQTQQRGVAIRLDLPSELPPIEGDPAEWRQVFFNVFRNALDATKAGTWIDVGGEYTSESVVVRIRDHGEGFPPGDIDRVFEPFVTTKDPGQGTGLGLAIVDRIVRENRGSVSAANWQEGGEIRIEVPRPGHDIRDRAPG